MRRPLDAVPSDHYSPVSFHFKVEFTLPDELIDSSRHTTLTRAENLALFRAQYDREADADFCEV